MTQASGAVILFDSDRSKNSLLVQTVQFLHKRKKEAQPVRICILGCASFGAVIRNQLNENHFSIDDFGGSITNIIAPSDPFHWVSCFEIFSNIFLFGQSHYNVIE